MADVVIAVAAPRQPRLTGGMTDGTNPSSLRVELTGPIGRASAAVRAMAGSSPPLTFFQFRRC